MCGDPSQGQWGCTVNTGFQSYSMWNDPVIQTFVLIGLVSILLIVTIFTQEWIRTNHPNHTTVIQILEYIHEGIIPLVALAFIYATIKIFQDVLSSEHIYYIIIWIASLFILGYITKNLKEMFGGK